MGRKWLVLPVAADERQYKDWVATTIFLITLATANPFSDFSPAHL